VDKFVHILSQKHRAASNVHNKNNENNENNEIIPPEHVENVNLPC
jgi:hypothetical protein